MQGVIGSLTELADAFSDLNKVLEGDLIGNKTIELHPDEYEIFDVEEEDGGSSQPGLPHGSV